MTLQDLGGLGDFVGGLGVLVTLIYVLFEYRRSVRDREMSAAFEGELAWSDFNLAIAQDPVLSELSVRSFTPGATLSDFSAGEQARLNFVTRAYLHRLEAQWFVSQRRGLPPEIWQKRRLWARAYIDSAIGGEAWRREKASGNLTEAFVREIESAPSGVSLPGAPTSAPAT
jgi:hypothetical protein